jgi:3-hydroxyisobutyrate dehydrogenase-like beta-hydroxyacid dehydrogenase
MSKNIVEKANLDKPLLIFNRSRARAEKLQATLPVDKTEIAASVAEGVAAADVIFTCLADDTAVRSALESTADIDIKGKLFIDCSTIHPDTTEAIAADLSARGASFVAAPVFGAPAMADAGQLVGVLAGPREAIERARPYFKGVTSRAEILFPDEPYSRATTLKVIGNTFIFNMVEQIAEGLVLGEKTGLGTAPVMQFIEAIFPGPYAAYAARMTSGDYHTRDEPLFAVDLARKDLRYAMGLAREAGTSLPNSEIADGHLAKVKEVQGASGDIAGIYGAVRQEAGLKFENGDDK